MLEKKYCCVGVIVCLVVFFSGWSYAKESEIFAIYSDQVTNPELEFDENIKLYLWEDTGVLAELETHKYKGNYMRFRHNNKKSWFGFGYAVFPDDNFRNMSIFKNGHLSVTMKAQGELPRSFRIGLKSGRTKGGETWVELEEYGFKNNGEWQTINIPIVDFVKAKSGFFDLTQVSQYFMIAGKGSVPIDMIFDFDEIFWVSQ